MLPFSRLRRSSCFSRSCTCLIDDILRLVSFVNWHLTLRLEHSEQLVVSVASHLTFLSLHASQLGSFLLCLYALFCACEMGGSEAVEGPGVLATDSAEGSESRPMIEPAVTGVYGVKALWLTGGKGGMPMGCGGGAAVVLGPVFIKPLGRY